MPANSNVSGTFGSAVGTVAPSANFYNAINGTNTQGLVANNYTASVALLSNQDAYQFNVLVTPGLNYADHEDTMSVALTNTENRGDSVYVMDLGGYTSSASQVIATANTVDSSYGAAYYPWLQTFDPVTGQAINVPPSTMIPAVFAYNDSVAYPWFAPAGINRGGLSTVIRAASKLSQGVRDDLYVGKVNPIATFPGQGVVVYGQKTLQTKASALDRLNVRRLMIALKRYIGQIANGLIFEQNNASTRNSFLAQVNPYLESVQQQQGLFAFKVVMDDSINNAAVIDRNELVGQIYLQPTKTAEFIYLNFTLTPTGATFA
jgi:phage tail sheath protein FI